MTGKSEQDKEEEIHQNKDCAAVLSADIRETPDVAKTDRTSRSQQDEAQTGRKHFASARRLITHKNLSLIVAYPTIYHTIADSANPEANLFQKNRLFTFPLFSALPAD